MDGLLFIALIAWVVLSAVNKKKRRAAAEAAKRAALEQAGQREAPSAQPAAKPVYDAPAERPKAPPAPKKAGGFDPFFGGLSDLLEELESGKEARPAQTQHAPAAASRPMTPPPRAQQQTRVQTNVHSDMHSSMSDRSTTMQSTLRHAIEASSITGHAHTESSITGIEPECPPVPETRATGERAAAQAPASAFAWDVIDVRRGLVLSEILGKPKALQR